MSSTLVPNWCVQSSIACAVVLHKKGVFTAGVGPPEATEGVAGDVDVPNGVHCYGVADVRDAGSELVRPELVACAIVLPEIGVGLAGVGPPEAHRLYCR